MNKAQLTALAGEEYRLFLLGKMEYKHNGTRVLAFSWMTKKYTYTSITHLN